MGGGRGDSQGKLSLCVGLLVSKCANSPLLFPLSSPAIVQSQPLNIAPRRPNFDLKRDVARKMQRLNIRTQLAIADIIRACNERCVTPCVCVCVCVCVGWLVVSAT